MLARRLLPYNTVAWMDCHAQRYDSSCSSLATSPPHACAQLYFSARRRVPPPPPGPPSSSVSGVKSSLFAR